MSNKADILILDEDKNIHDDLGNQLKENFGASVTSSFDKNDAIQKCKEKVFNLIIVDPLIPSSLDGEEFISEQRQFYSINKDTPIIVFTEDIEFTSKITTKYSLHPESKLGPITKILSPVKHSLGL